MKIDTTLTSLFCVLCTLLWGPSYSTGQEKRNGEDAEVFQVLEIADGVLTGPGATALLKSCRSSRFVLFGEAHGVAGIAEMVSATHQSLSSDSFQHLVIEAGDWFSTQLAIGNLDEVLDSFPYSLAFDYNGDLELIGQIKKSSQDQTYSIIGIDQEACAIHAFEFLSKNAQSYSARQLSKCLLLKSLFQSGRYIRTDYQAELEVLNSRVGNDQTSSAIIDAISESMEIFVDHVQGRINKSVERRESRMMNCFEEAVQQLASDSRLLFKMGGAHTLRGIGPNGVKTLGEHVAQHADRNGHRSLHISIYPWREDGSISLPEEYRESTYVLVDCQKQLSSFESKGASVDDALRQRLNNVDWIILMPNAEPASRTVIREKQKRFVRSRLIQVGLVLVPILLLLPMYLDALWAFIGWIRGQAKEAWLLRSLPVWISMLMIGLIAIQVLLMLRAPSSASPTSYWLVVVLNVFYVASIVFAIGAGWIVFRRSNHKRFDRTFYWMGCLGCTGLALFIHGWGMGQLLGI